MGKFIDKINNLLIKLFLPLLMWSGSIIALNNAGYKVLSVILIISGILAVSKDINKRRENK